MEAFIDYGCSHVAGASAAAVDAKVDLGQRELLNPTITIAKAKTNENVINEPHEWWQVFGVTGSQTSYYQDSPANRMENLLNTMAYADFCVFENIDYDDDDDDDGFGPDYVTCYRHQFNHRVQQTTSDDLLTGKPYYIARTVLINALLTIIKWHTKNDKYCARIVPLITDYHTLNVCHGDGRSALWMAIESGSLLTVKALLDRVPLEVEIYQEKNGVDNEPRPQPIASAVIALLKSGRSSSRQQLVPIICEIRAAKARHAVYHDTVCSIMTSILSFSSVDIPVVLCNIIRDYLKPSGFAVKRLEVVLRIAEQSPVEAEKPE